MNRPLVSIILPAYNEGENLAPLYTRLAAVAEGLPRYAFEFVFVDDNSTDATAGMIGDLRRADDRVHHLRLARNCGSHAAIHAGLSVCRGDAAVVMAADLQDPPEILPQLLDEWEKGFQVVWGVRKTGQGDGIEPGPMARLFYFLMNHLTEIRQSPTGADVCLMQREVIEAFKAAAEKNISIFMLVAWLGFSQSKIEYAKAPRHAGDSKWGFGRRLKLALDSLMSFSYLPLRAMSATGLLCVAVGLIYALTVFVGFLAGSPADGWALVLIVVFLMGGVQMIMLGVLGEYLWRTHEAVRGRPPYVIEKNTLCD